MPCPLCGETCRCGSETSSTAARAISGPEMPSTEAQAKDVPATVSSLAAQDTADDSAWRAEVSARLNRYHSRRKPRPPRYPSLRLRFEEKSTGNFPPEHSFLHSPSNHALAFDEISQSDSVEPLERDTSHGLEFPAVFSSETQQISNPSSRVATSAPVTAKIIEFPRSWDLPPVPLDELAEPIVTHPRILEVPELLPSPPALGGITIEAAKQPEVEKRPGIDIPLQSAPLARRIAAAAIDNLLIAVACGLFAFIFWKLTDTCPPLLQELGVLAGLAGLFWASYQYLLVIYAFTTPGLSIARLELCRFDGSRATRSIRRWRVLASFLSALSLGMGYLWVFLDEDSLCWHDRITRTYLARRSSTKPQEPGLSSAP
jgi:hypothetical protein